MPPLARTLIVLCVLAGWPGSLAAQTLTPGNRPESASGPLPSAASGAGMFSWAPATRQDTGAAVTGGDIRQTSYEEPARAGNLESHAQAPGLSLEGRGQSVSGGSGSGSDRLPPAGKSNSVPLAPQGRLRPEAAPHKTSGLPTLVTTASSLAIVLGLFFVLAWAMRRANPGRSGILPSDVLEVLGRAPLAARQQVYLIRCGRKLVLVHASPDGVEPLTEITDPEEVDRVLGLCRQSQPNSATAAFRQVFQQFTGEPTAPGFLGNGSYDDVQLANAGISRRGRGSLEDEYV